MAPDEWTRGLDINELRAQAKMLASHAPPSANGAFSLPRERDVAAARATTGGFLSHAEWCALCYRARTNSSVETFGGFFLRFVGDIHVKHVGGDLAKARAALETLSSGRSIIVELWTEAREQMREFAGWQVVGHRVLADSALKTIVRFGSERRFFLAPRVEAATCSLFPGLLSHELEAVREELAAYEAAVGDGAFATHYSSYNIKRTWRAFALQGFSHDPLFIEKPAEMAKSWRDAHPAECAAKVTPTLAASFFPKTLSIAARFGKYERLRFMLVKAGGGLRRHADITNPDAGVKDGSLMRLHFPIHTDPRALFDQWDLTGRKLVTHFPIGKCAYLDQRKPHAHVNGGAEDRIHLVMDAWADRALRAAVEAGAL